MNSGISRGKPQHAGFSIIELMVVIAILGVLSAMAVPSFVASVERYKVNAVRDELIATMQLARMESVRQGVQVSLIRKTNCAVKLASADDWRCGYDLFVDSNANGTLDNNNTEPVLKSVVLPLGYGLRHTNQGAALRVNSWGMFQGVGQNFVVFPPSGPSSPNTSTLSVSIGGRIRSVTGSTE
jgi:type IV fimbrial biogenesis protein FimT